MSVVVVVSSVLNVNHTVMCRSCSWGYNFAGQVRCICLLHWCSVHFRCVCGLQTGNGYANGTAVLSVPSADILSNVLSVSAGASHTCVVMNGTNGVRCWGMNGAGALGIGSTVSVHAPPSSDIPGLPPVSVVAAGTNFTCVLTMSGGVRWYVVLCVSCIRCDVTCDCVCV